MSQYNDTGHLTELPDVDVPMYSRVKKTATGVDLADAADKTYGSATEPGYAAVAGERHNTISVKTISAAGTHIAIAGGAVAAGQEIEGAAGGKVVAIDAGTAIGLCRSTATADGDRIEVLYY